MDKILKRLEKRSRLNRNSGCIIWTGATVSAGYGHINIAGKFKLTHRVVWELANGPIPDGMVVCHTCDVPLCINVEHLFLGTRRDNTRDAIQKGRFWRGRGNKGRGRPKLTEEAVRDIRESAAPANELARKYDVTVVSIHNVRAFRTWKATPTPATPAPLRPQQQVVQA